MFGRQPDLPVIRQLNAELERLGKAIREKEDLRAAIDREDALDDSRVWQSSSYGELRQRE